MRFLQYLLINSNTDFIWTIDKYVYVFDNSNPVEDVLEKKSFSVLPTHKRLCKQ